MTPKLVRMCGYFQQQKNTIGKIEKIYLKKNRKMGDKEDWSKKFREKNNKIISLNSCYCQIIQKG